MADIEPGGQNFWGWVVAALMGVAGILWKIVRGNEAEDKQEWKAEKLDLKQQIAAMAKKMEEMSQRILDLERKDAANVEKIKHLEYELGKKVNRETLERRLNDQ